MRRTSLPNLDDLRAFEAVARLGSVRAAGDALSLTHSAVSRRVSKLADDLRLTLFEKHGRGLRLTREGAALSESTTEALELVERTLADIRRAKMAEPILLSSERSVAMCWLIPRLSAFQDAHPEIGLNLSVGGGGLDFANAGSIVAIRRLDFAVDPAWSVETLAEERVGPVMHPGMLERFREGDYVALGSLTRRNAWRRWLKDHPDAPRPLEFRYLDHHFLIVAAAMAGLGVAMCPRVLAVDDVESGRLIAPMSFTPDGSRYGLITQAGPTPPHVTVLTAWIVEMFRQLAAAFDAMD